VKYSLYTHKCRPSTKGFGPGAVGHWKRRENPLWTSVVTTTMMMRMMNVDNENSGHSRPAPG
jgi:hypothetical protein